MKAYVITLQDNKYSVDAATRCIESAAKFGLTVDYWTAVDKNNAVEIMEAEGLKWTWAGEKNDRRQRCPITKLQQFPYTAKDLRAKIGCSMSHYLLWQSCVDFGEPYLILEHDAVFLRPLPEFEFNGICQINDPNGCTRKGSWWSQQMKRRGGEGAFNKTWVTTPSERHIPDGLAGNSAYLVKPHAAQQLVNKFHELGVWPNDAMMCKQLFPYLQEYYPFITKVIQTKSTTVG